MPQEIFALGSNGNFQLGLGHDDDVSVPERITSAFDGNIVSQIVSGGNHSLFITENGQVYGSGSNNYSQLSYRIKDTVIRRPAKLDLTVDSEDRDCSLAAAGWEFSVFVTSRNEILSCGNGPKGELGVGKVDTGNGLYKLTDFPPNGSKVRKIAAGLSHVVVLLDDNTVYGWGSSRKGQIGQLNLSNKICREPVLVRPSDITDVTHIACGRDFTVLGFASGRIELLGNSLDKYGLNQHLRSTVPFMAIDCGWSTIHCLGIDGITITSWGNNSHFQHAPSIDNLKFDTLTDGSEHSVVITNDHKTVYCWGWGEHGNCGIEGINDNNQLYKLYTTIGTDRLIKNVYCGHATTWILL